MLYDQSTWKAIRDPPRHPDRGASNLNRCTAYHLLQIAASR
ncbi:hypothetical protein [Methanothrix sp.]